MATMYTGDNWVVFKSPNNSHYRLLVGTSGGYLSGDSWRLNSGITSFEDDGDFWIVHGHSGSKYRVHKESNTVRMNCLSTYTMLVDKGWVEIENQDWVNFDWKI